MALHRLPSLATLHLGAATGMPGNNADGERPVKATRVEPPAPPAAPPVAPPPPAEPAMLLLTHLPRDVIGKVVTQAALDARKAAVPASAICAWIRRFCTSARMQGVTCDDYWYKLALAAFGVDPDTLGEPPPKWMRGGQNWREFFATVCNAFFSHPSYLPRIQKGFPELLTYNLTQRELDEALTTLMHYCGTVIKDKRLLRTLEEADAVFKTDWDRAMRGKQSALYSFHFWPMMGLLLLRGAEPYTSLKYAALDNEVYVAIMATRGDALSTHERLSTEEALRRIADAMARGASLNVACVTVQNNPKNSFTLQTALVANNSTIIQWLLDRGAAPFAPGKYFEAILQFDYMRQLVTKTVYDYDEWQLDWDRTKQMIDHLYQVFEQLGDMMDDERAMRANENVFHDSFLVDGLQIMDTAITHIEQSWPIDNDYHMPEGANLDDMTDADFIRGPRARLYEAWMAVRNKLYSVQFT